MPIPQTLPTLHFIIPSGSESNFYWQSGVYMITPIQMLNGNFAVPYSVYNTPGLSQEFKDSLTNLNNVLELTCCDFKNCNHGG